MSVLGTTIPLVETAGGNVLVDELELAAALDCGIVGSTVVP
jgi:hypothetical protein